MNETCGKFDPIPNTLVLLVNPNVFMQLEKSRDNLTHGVWVKLWTSSP